MAQLKNRIYECPPSFTGPKWTLSDKEAINCSIEYATTNTPLTSILYMPSVQFSNLILVSGHTSFFTKSNTYNAIMAQVDKMEASK